MEPMAWLLQHDEGRTVTLPNDGTNNPDNFIKLNQRYTLICPLYRNPPGRTPSPAVLGLVKALKLTLPVLILLKDTNQETKVRHIEWLAGTNLLKTTYVVQQALAAWKKEQGDG